MYAFVYMFARNNRRMCSGQITVNPLQNFICSGGDKDVAPLEYNQVMAIYNKDFGIDRLNEVRDSFVFQCFTGYAYQDAYALSPDNIVKVGFSGERWLFKERGKTEVMEAVPISPLLRRLLKNMKTIPSVNKKVAFYLYYSCPCPPVLVILAMTKKAPFTMTSAFTGNSVTGVISVYPRSVAPFTTCTLSKFTGFP